MHSISQHIETEYRQRTPQSAALFDRAREVLPGGDTRTSAYFAPYPLALNQAEGSTLPPIHRRGECGGVLMGKESAPLLLG